MPSCMGGTCRHCDNDGETECTPEAHHCTCAYGSYYVTHYSTDDSTWVAMPPSFPTPMTASNLELQAVCPESSCDY